ncbi:MAG: helix-turn-helix transcriptional regulator [Clostridia bacterium]|nr:helix-turn-helix transcriptional regulator [Clostridia bacterium]
MEKETSVQETKKTLPDESGNERRDCERLPEPPYEKRFSELGSASAEQEGDGEITVYRYTKRTTGMELQIRSAYQMVFSISGACELNIQGSRARLPNGGIMLIARGVPHLIEIPEDSIIVGAMLPVPLLKREFNKIVEFRSPISSFISNSLWGNVTGPYMLFNKPGNKYIRSLTDMLISEGCYPSANSGLIKNFILMTLIGYLSSYSPSQYELSSIRMVRSDQIPKILNYISENYRTVTLESLAKHFHYTVPYVSKLIRASTGMTFTSILRETKFDVCRSMLLNSDLKIYQIAEIAGFQNTDHFNRTFKKRTGLTPSDFKKSGLDNAE